MDTEITCVTMGDVKAKPFSYRPSVDNARRLNDLIAATEHDKTLFLDKALEAHLPVLELRYARELAELRAKRGGNYTITPASAALNETAANSAGRSAARQIAEAAAQRAGAVPGESGGGRAPVRSASVRARHRSKNRPVA